MYSNATLHWFHSFQSNVETNKPFLLLFLLLFLLSVEKSTIFSEGRQPKMDSDCRRDRGPLNNVPQQIAISCSCYSNRFHWLPKPTNQNQDLHAIKSIYTHTYSIYIYIVFNVVYFLSHFAICYWILLIEISGRDSIIYRSSSSNYLSKVHD